MGRRLRFVPEGSLVEVTCRTAQSRLLLRPSPNLNRIILGILGRAQRRYGLRIHAFVFMSNHYHLLVSPDTARQLAVFMAYLNANLAKEAGRLHRWAHHLWSRRYHLLEISPEEEAQLGRLRYILSHGCKEGLVETPGDWPGVHCVAALLDDQPLTGLWFDRTVEYEARRKGLDLGTLDFATPETVRLEPLPCWAHLPADTYRRRVADLVGQIVEDAVLVRRRSSLRPLGRDAILRQNPHAQPLQITRRPSPACHAASKDGDAACARPTPSSSPPIAAPPSACAPEASAFASRPDASRPRCPSCVSPAAEQGAFSSTSCTCVDRRGRPWTSPFERHQGRASAS